MAVVYDKELDTEKAQVLLDAESEDEDGLDFHVASVFGEMKESDEEWEWNDLVGWYLNLAPGSMERSAVDTVFVRMPEPV